MRVALIVTEYITEPTFAGGLANYTYRVAKGLQQLGHEPIVMVLAAKNETIWHDGIQVRRVDAFLSARIRMGIKKSLSVSRQILSKARQLKTRPSSSPQETSKAASTTHTVTDETTFISILGTTLYFLTSCSNMRKALLALHQESPIDIAHYTHLIGMGALRTSIPTVVRLSSYRELWASFKYRYNNPVENTLVDTALRRADQVIAPSNWVANYVSEKLNFPVQVVESPFVPPEPEEDPSVYERAVETGETYGLYFGSLAEWKGVFVLAEALKSFLKQHPQHKFIFVGRNLQRKVGIPASEYLRQQLSDFADRVKLLDKLRHPQLFPFIRNAQFVALPSLAENFPNACLEAMWFERVTIGTAGRSFEQLIDHGRSGFLCEPGSVSSLCDAMTTAAALSKEEQTQMGKQAKARIEQLSPQKAVADLLAVYSSIIQ